MSSPSSHLHALVVGGAAVAFGSVVVPFALLAACGSVASGTSGTGGTPPLGDAGPASVAMASNPRDLAVAADLPVAVDASNAFALDLYGQLAPTVSGGNLMTSPLSATLALTMTYGGAEGTTASQMASVLHIPSSGPSIFDAQNALTQALAGRGAAAAEYSDAPSDYEVQVVNSVWGQTGYAWTPSFLTLLAKSYGTGVDQEDFKDNPAAGEAAINDWVSAETSGAIYPLLPPNLLDTNTRMVLVNAIHVKLPWESPFDPDGTLPATFTRGDGSHVQAEVMSQSYESDVGYAETAIAQFVSVPLAGNQLSAVFALPRGQGTLATLLSSLTMNSFTLPALPDDSELDLTLPKFSFTGGSIELTTPLEALGMTDAFNGATANFQGLCANPPGGNLYITHVIQRATLDVAEGGVEAAAATAVSLGDDGGAEGSDAGPPTVITVNIDHPFMVALVDASGAILFLGQIDDPTSSGS